MNVLRLSLGVFLGVGIACASDTISPEIIKKQALEIDRLVATNFRKNKIAVPEVSDDSIFLRRAFLVSVGRMPTPKEALQFLELEHPDKRALLLQYLFTSEGYKSHLQNWVFDLLTLRESSGPANQDNNTPLIHWVRNAIEVNMPWDDFCRKLLTTKGNAWLGSGASGYFAKDKSMQEDNLANTMRVFTGMRMECAQCHDDPFQEWERMDFYQLNAFVNGATTMGNKISGTAKSMQEFQAANEDKYIQKGMGQLIGFARKIDYMADYGVPENKGNGRVKIPSDWQYNDADPGEYVGGKTPFGAKLKTDDSANDTDSMEKFADWMTDDQTPQFAQTIALRLWERVMGVSLTEVTGDYVEPADTNFSNLIKHLSKLIRAYDYDIKVFQQTLMSTTTFQFVSSTKELKNGAPNALDGRRASRMTAEQIWDSLLALTFIDPEALDKRVKPTEFYHNSQYVMPMKDLMAKVQQCKTQAQFDKFVIGLYDKLRDGEQITDQEPAHEAMTDHKTPGGMSSALKGLVRASELPSPAPSGHFLATFGQSTRKSAIDEASKEGAVSQALELLNGSVQELIVHNDEATVNQVVDQISDTEQRIRTTFLVVLNRPPADDEMQMCLDLIEISDDESDAYRNLVAGLISSQEFYFIF